jgi:hypothetical protein
MSATTVGLGYREETDDRGDGSFGGHSAVEQKVGGQRWRCFVWCRLFPFNFLEAIS